MSKDTDATTLSDISTKLERLFAEVRILRDRLEQIEGRSTPKPCSTPKIEGRNPEILALLASIHIDDVEADDQLAFATGYVAGKSGMEPDSLCFQLGVGDYVSGFELGRRISAGEETVPAWDQA